MTGRTWIRIAACMAGILLTHPSAATPTVHTTEHFDIQIQAPSPPPTGAQEDYARFARELGTQLEQARAAVASTLAHMATPPALPGRIRVVVTDSTAAFQRLSGRPWYQAAATAGDRMLLQPVSVLRRLEDLDATLRHELAHIPVETLAGRHAPRWLVEGVVMLVADDRPPGYPADQERVMSLKELERLNGVLTDPRAGAEAVRRAYRLAYHATTRLVVRIQAQTRAKSFQKALGLLLDALPALRTETLETWAPAGVPVSSVLGG